MGCLAFFRSTALFAAVLSVGGLIAGAEAQRNPPSEPMIRIEAGVHTAAVKGIDADRACGTMITGSDDKTARIWSVPQDGGAPTLLRTLRPPLDDGDVGKIYTVAMTPDGALAAVGGWSRHLTHYVMIFDVARGTLIAELGPLDNVVNRVAFSRDGRYLAAGLAGGKGIHAWERQGAADWRKVLTDDDFNGRDSYGITFGPDGRLFAVGDDGTLRRYSRSFKRDLKITTKGGKEPYSVAVHPGGKIVAIGHDDTMSVELYDAETLALVHAPDTGNADKTKNISSVAWSSDGKRLWAGGTLSIDSKRQMRAWDEEGRGTGTNYPTGSENTIREIMSCKEWLGYVTSDPGFGRLDRGGQPINWVGAVQVDMRRKIGDAFTVSQNGRQVRFGLEYSGDKPAVFDIDAGTLSDAPEPRAGFLPPRVDGLDVRDWKDSRTPLFRGQPLKLKQYEDSRSLAIAPDARSFVLGTSWVLRSYDAQGKEQWAKPTTAVVWGVNITGDKRFVVAAQGDGTLRWFRANDGRELLTLFVHALDRRWVAWTPKGYYMASDKGDDLIGWHQNRGWGKPAEFTFAHERRDQYRRPDIVKRVIELADEEQAIGAAAKRK